MDDEGFHFYDGNGLYKDTILSGEGDKYRGSGKDVLTPNMPLIYTSFTYSKFNMDDFSRVRSSED